MLNDIKANNIESTNIPTTEILSICEPIDCPKKSLKSFFSDFSVYEVIDYTYDKIYQIPDVVDKIIIDFDNFESECDKFDYALAAFSGLITGLLDCFLVGQPGNSILGKITDSFIDDKVLKFSQMVYEIDKKNNNSYNKKKPESISSAIGYLERRYKVNYDARFACELIGGDVLDNFTPSSHHLKSLAHCPDIVGLFFSILDQFTNKTTIVNNGKIYRLENVNGNYELRGNDIVSKIVCGVINWVGHLMSDVSGSSGTRGHKGRRGMGIPIPGFELFQLAGKDRNKEMVMMAELTEKMFLKGYDFRFGIAMYIPVIVNCIIVSIFWILRERFQYNKNWKDITKSASNDKRLLRMTFVSLGCFSIVDLGDAIIRSEGNIIMFALRVNYIGVCKFAFAGYREFIVRAKNLSDEYIDGVLEKEWKKVFRKA